MLVVLLKPTVMEDTATSSVELAFRLNEPTLAFESPATMVMLAKEEFFATDKDAVATVKVLPLVAVIDGSTKSLVEIRFTCVMSKFAKYVWPEAVVELMSTSMVMVACTPAGKIGNVAKVTAVETVVSPTEPPATVYTVTSFTLILKVPIKSVA